MHKKVDKKTIEKIKEEWNAIAEVRNIQISSGSDISYNKVIIPSILKYTESLNLETVLDFGCGNGYLENALEGKFIKYYGVDLSRKMIEIAKSNSINKNAHFYEGDGIRLLKDNDDLFTTIFANMSLMNVIDLNQAIEIFSRKLTKNGAIVTTIIHPCFWSYYKNYIESPWFNYQDEIVIEAPFEISKESTSYPTTLIHRPLMEYINILNSKDLRLEKFEELMPSNFDQMLFPRSINYPKFILMISRKI